LHHKTENIATDVAYPTFPRLAFRIYLQTGTAVVVPRTVGHVHPSLTSQFKITANEIDDVNRVAYLFFDVSGRGKGHRRLLCGFRLREDALAAATADRSSP
jgi:hypothetical protein